MDYSEKYKKITADIIISARKKKGLTQADLSKHLNIAQSTISRIEAETLTPSVFMWFEIAKFLEIPIESISDGFIDCESDSEIETGKKENGFVLKAKYSKLKCLKVRSLMPLIYFIIDKLGQDSFEKIVEEMKLDRRFFVNLDNQVNLTFLADLIKILDEEHGITIGSIGEIGEYVPLEKSHGNLSIKYKHANDYAELLKVYVENATKYQSFFNLSIEPTFSGSLMLTFTPADEIKKQLSTKHKNLVPYLEHMQEETLKYFLNYKVGSSNRPISETINMIKVQSLIDRDPFIRYEFKLK